MYDVFGQYHRRLMKWRRPADDYQRPQNYRGAIAPAAIKCAASAALKDMAGDDKRKSTSRLELSAAASSPGETIDAIEAADHRIGAADMPLSVWRAAKAVCQRHARSAA